MHAGGFSKNFWLMVRQMRLRLHEHGPPGNPPEVGGSTDPAPPAHKALNG
jgi:hypothetical protein